MAHRRARGVFVALAAADTLLAGDLGGVAPFGLARGRHTATVVAATSHGRAASERRTFFVCHR